MRTIGTLEAKTHLSKLLGEVELGEEIVITRHGKPVARVQAVDIQAARAARWRQFIEAAAKARIQLPPEETIKDYISAGRKH